ncbi:MAG: hypothetical protein RIC56_14860 [Pseudomonadales bacterium]
MTVSLSAAPLSVVPGRYASLASVCGSLEVGGAAPRGATSADVESVYCPWPGGAVDQPGTVAVGSAEPTISLSANPRRLSSTETSTLIWSVQNASSCRASGGWSGERALSGRASVNPLTGSATYSLTCVGPGGSALSSVSVERIDRFLRWEPPTQNIDGSPLTDLAGYVMYWGRESRRYGSSAVINDPTVTRWEANLPPGTYFFAVTAVDADGNESDYSNEVRRTIP